MYLLFPRVCTLHSNLLPRPVLLKWGSSCSGPRRDPGLRPPPAGTPLNGNYFTSTRLRSINSVNIQGAFANVTAVNVNFFPALSGLGVSNALLVYPPGSVNQPHTHTQPRGTETLYIIEGTLDFGLIDTIAPVPVLFTQTLQQNDIFVFPRGLVHYQINRSKLTVRAYVSFSSTNPGLVSLPRTLFGVKNIDNDVLTKSFNVKADVIKTLTKANQS